MKSKFSDLEQKYLLLFKIDAKNLMERIKNRRQGYIEVFALKRTRRHFKEIFFTRYNSATFFDLTHLPSEVIESLDHFHKIADDLFYYLKHTEDMPNSIEDEVLRQCIKMDKAYMTLSLFIDSALSGENSMSAEQDFYDDADAEDLIPVSDDLFSPLPDEEFSEPEFSEDNVEERD